MELLILILLSISYLISIAINIWQYLTNKELRHELDMKNNSLKLWLDEEVDMKRIYKNLSDKLIEERDKLKNDLSSLRKRFNKNNKLIKSYIRWRINIDTLISKFR